MDILQYMKAAHDQLKGTLQTLQNETSVRVRREGLDQWSRDLDIHLTLESQYLYPEVSGLFPEADTVVTAGLANAAALRKKLKALRSLVEKPLAQQAGTDRKLEDLAAVLESHVTLQEQHLMPRLRGTMRTEDREDLGTLFVDVRDELMAGAGESMRPEAGRAKSKKRA